jgi:hypothetical protein
LIGAWRRTGHINNRDVGDGENVSGAR